MCQGLAPTACLGSYSCGHQKVMRNKCVLRSPSGRRWTAPSLAVGAAHIAHDYLVMLEEHPRLCDSCRGTQTQTTAMQSRCGECCNTPKPQKASICRHAALS